MNEVLAARYRASISRWLGEPGRMVGYSKTLYMDAHSDHAVVFNANVCFNDGKVWWGDLDLTESEVDLARLFTWPPGECDEVCVGLVIGRRDPRWG
jgi:hypothetical protein